MKLSVAGLLDEFLLFVGEENRWVGFLEEEETGDLDYAVGYCRGPERPTPGGVFGDEAAGYGSDCWAEEGCEGVDGDGFASFFGDEEIGEDATSESERR